MTEIVAEPTQRQKAEALEAFILAELPPVDLQTTHVLSPGLYARSVFIPAGTVATGAVHKKDHISVLQGDVTVSTDEGTRRITGQHVFASKAGTKRALIAHADTVWTTIHATDKTDIAQIEEEMVDDAHRLLSRKALEGAAPRALENAL